MTTFDPDEFADWISKSKIKKGELAKRLGVSATTISRWLAGTMQPATVKLALINAIMRGEDSAASTCTIPVRLTDELYAVAERMAAKRGLSVDDWISDCLQRLADEVAAVFMEHHGIASVDKTSIPYDAEPAPKPGPAGEPYGGGALDPFA